MISLQQQARIFPLGRTMRVAAALSAGRTTPLSSGSPHFRRVQRVQTSSTPTSKITFSSLQQQQHQQQCQRHLSSSSSSSSGSLANNSLEKEIVSSAATGVNLISHSLPAQQQQQQPPISLKRMYRYFQLLTYQPDELEVVFDKITTTAYSEDDKQQEPAVSLRRDVVDCDNLQAFLLTRIRELEKENGNQLITMVPEEDEREIDSRRIAFAAVEARRIMDILCNTSSNSGAGDDISTQNRSLSKSEFVERIREKAVQVDIKRTLPITLSMLLVGSSVGIIAPAMPFIVSDLGLSHSQFGMVVSAFALSKMLGNVPSAVGVERHGRKPYATYSLGIIALATAGIGIAGSFEELYVCRFLTGIGVAALSTSATMMLTDISTPLNRATTIAPIMSAFSAGTALGPAMGGYLVDNVGLQATFSVVGLSFAGVAVLNRFIIEETRPPIIRFPWQVESEETNSPKESVATSLVSAVSLWAPLMRNPKIRSVMIMNGLYWIALAGAQMTLLPLILTNPDGLAMSATQVGQAYMGMSVIQIFGNPLFGRLADRMGKVPAIIGGCTVTGTSMAALTFCGDYTQLAAALGAWAVGSSMLSTAPVAYVSDKVTDSERAQALALLRTCGDVGFLAGASGIGALSDWTGSLDIAMQYSAGLLMTGTAWFVVRQMISDRINPASSSKQSK